MVRSRPDTDSFVALLVLQVLFVLASPDVYKSSNSDCYIVFGEAKVCTFLVHSYDMSEPIFYATRSRT